MSRLSNILKKPEEVEFRGEKFTLHALTGDSIHLFMEDSKNLSIDEIKEKTQEIIFQSLKPGLEDITMEEVKLLDMEPINFLMGKIQALNNLKVSGKDINLVKKEIENAKARRSRKPEEKAIPEG